MPIKESQKQIAAIVPADKARAFKKLAKKHFRSVSAELALLIDKALLDDENSNNSK
jgi:hypothetical protein